MAKMFTFRTGDLVLYALYLKKRAEHSGETSITYDQYNKYQEAVRQSLTSNFINHELKAGITTPGNSTISPDMRERIDSVYFMNDNANRRYVISSMFSEETIRARVLSVFPTFIPSLLEPEGYQNILGIKTKAPEPGDEN